MGISIDAFGPSSASFCAHFVGDRRQMIWSPLRSTISEGVEAAPHLFHYDSVHK